MLGLELRLGRGSAGLQNVLIVVYAVGEGYGNG